MIVRALLVGQRVLRLPAVDLRMPGSQIAAVKLCQLLLALSGLQHHLGQYVLDVADDRQVDTDILLDRGRVDVDMDDLGVRRKGGDLAGDPVVEAGADGDEQVAMG